MRMGVEVSQYWLGLTKAILGILTGEIRASWPNTNSNTFSTNAKRIPSNFKTYVGIGIYSKRIQNNTHGLGVGALNNRASSNPYALVKKNAHSIGIQNRDEYFIKSTEAQKKRWIFNRKPEQYHTKKKDSRPKTQDRSAITLYFDS